MDSEDVKAFEGDQGEELEEGVRKYDSGTAEAPKKQF